LLNILQFLIANAIIKRKKFRVLSKPLKTGLTDPIMKLTRQMLKYPGTIKCRNRQTIKFKNNRLFVRNIQTK